MQTGAMAYRPLAGARPGADGHLRRRSSAPQSLALQALAPQDQASNCDNPRMEITRQCVVGLTWTLKDTLGEELDVLEEAVEFLVGGDDLFTRIEDALQGHEAGERLQLQLEPEEAFGDFDDQLIFLEPRALFPAQIEEGMVIEGHALPAGCSAQAPRDALYTITDVYPEHVVLDGNHPLSGIALRLQLKVESVRAATEEEVAQRSAGTGFFQLKLAPPAA